MMSNHINNRIAPFLRDLDAKGPRFRSLHRARRLGYYGTDAFPGSVDWGMHVANFRDYAAGCDPRRRPAILFHRTSKMDEYSLNMFFVTEQCSRATAKDEIIKIAHDVYLGAVVLNPDPNVVVIPGPKFPVFQARGFHGYSKISNSYDIDIMAHPLTRVQAETIAKLWFERIAAYIAVWSK
jgi:hypothetical protein